VENRRYYDEFSNWYEKHRHEGYHAMIDRLETDLVLPYARGKNVLEVGCGTGLILRQVAAVSESAVGIDISPGMLEKARERGLDVREADVIRLPFEDEAFDVVYSFKVLAHVERSQDALREMIRVTKPGGTLVLEYYNRRSLRYWMKRLFGPGKISKHTNEGAVFTRWDEPSQIQDALPENVRFVDFAGVRVVTPAALCCRIPIVAPLLSRIEFRLRDSPLKIFGGFLVVVIEKTSR
jgi:SAM-dependent methyltransferase